MEVNFLFQIIVIIFSVVVHEVAHGYAAYFLGDPTAKYAGRLTLNPLRHLELFGSFLVPLLTYLSPGGVIFGWAKPVPFNPHNLKNKYGKVIVALAGPLSNLLIAFVVALGIRLGGVSWGSTLTFLVLITFVNLTLATFNMIPIPPLDGFKVLEGLLPLRLRFVSQFIEQNTFLIIIILIFTLSLFLDPLVLWLFRVFTGLH